MTVVYKTKGFVFKKEDKSEANRIFTIFTKDFGKINVLGRAIRKIHSKLRSGIDIFYLSEIEFVEGKHQKTLTDAVLLNKPSVTFKNGNILVAQRISSLLENFVKGQEKDDKIFQEIEKMLNAIYGNTAKISGELVYQYFFWNFLSSQGYHFNVNVCASCRARLNPYAVYFSAKEGGVICKPCIHKDEASFKINSDVVKILRIILAKKWDVLLKLKIDDLSRIMLENISQDTEQRLAPVNS